MSGSFQSWTAALALSLAVAGCGGSPADNSVSGAARAGLNTMQAASVVHLQAVEARGFLASHPEALVLDVRDASEGGEGGIDGARRVPIGELTGRLSEIDAWKTRPVVVVGDAGMSSRKACQVLTAAGFQQVMNLEGGVVAWQQAGN